MEKNNKIVRVDEKEFELEDGTVSKIRKIDEIVPPFAEADGIYFFSLEDENNGHS
jgi:hypothetical protein